MRLYERNAYLKQCPVCGSPGTPIKLSEGVGIDPISCSAPCYLYEWHERGGCLISRRWFERDRWQMLTTSVLFDPKVFTQPQVLPEGFRPWIS